MDLQRPSVQPSETIDKHHQIQKAYSLNASHLILVSELIVYWQQTVANSGSFNSYVVAFETQAGFIQPSLAERIEIFRDGLTTHLQTRVLLTPEGFEWTDWQQFLKFARRFADADLAEKSQ